MGLGEQVPDLCATLADGRVAHVTAAELNAEVHADEALEVLQAG